MNFQIENNLVKVTAALVEILNGQRKIAVEYPYEGQPDFTVTVIDSETEI